MRQSKECGGAPAVVAGGGSMSAFRRGSRLAVNSLDATTCAMDMAGYFTPGVINLGGYLHRGWLDGNYHHLYRVPISDEEALFIDTEAIRGVWTEVGDCIRWACDAFDPVEESSVTGS